MASPAKKLQCFIAMAFDHTDTDDVFEALKAVLGKNIRSVRVDRLEHNDDIDDRIMKEIERADFMIADLTYARPSVYFEAGFAQRNVPVIYTARHDHLRPQMDDPHGNFKVHFDLQMKNIIPWKNSGDRQFQQRLKSRVAHVTAPLLKQRASEEASKRRTADFDRQSVYEKREYLRTSFRRHFAGLKYTVEEVNDRNQSAETAFLSTSNFFRGAIVCAKYDASRYRYVSFKVFPSITKQVCQFYEMFLIRRPPYSNEVFKRREWTPEHLLEEIVICSFGKNGIARMAKEIHHLRRDNHVLTYSDTSEIAYSSTHRFSVTREVRVHVIESLPILVDSADELKTLFPAST